MLKYYAELKIAACQDYLSSGLVDMYDIDGVVVVTAKDISSEPEDVIRFVNYLSEQGVEVASIYNDLPNPDDYNSKETMRTKYCTVTIFEDV